MEMRWGAVPIRIHPALPMMLCLGITKLGFVPVATLSIALALHEAGHLLAARRMRVRVLELELMPFGGATRLEAVWRLRPAQVLAVSLAGPLASLLGCAITLACRRWLTAEWGWALLKSNALLGLFNLLPALPLDGGRALCGLLTGRMGADRAAALGVFLGRALALSLVLLAVWEMLKGRPFNLSYPLLAGYLIASGVRERAAAGGDGLLSLMDRRAELRGEGVLPVCWLAAREDLPVAGILPRLRPRRLHRVAVYDEHMRFLAVLEEDALLRASLGQTAITLGQALREQTDEKPRGVPCRGASRGEQPARGGLS